MDAFSEFKQFLVAACFGVDAVYSLCMNIIIAPLKRWEQP
jgi:hypothetical protein